MQLDRPIQRLELDLLALAGLLQLQVHDLVEAVHRDQGILECQVHTRHALQWT